MKGPAAPLPSPFSVSRFETIVQLTDDAEKLNEIGQ